MQDKKRRIIPFEVRSSAPDGSEFDGYGSVFHTIDTYGTMFAADAFNDSIAEFRENGFVGGLNHDWHKPIGKLLDAKIDPKGLFLSNYISATTDGLDVRILVKDKVIKKLSIGFRTLGRTWFETADEVKAYWSSVGYTPTAQDTTRSEYGACLITKAQLIEVSPVTFPSNDLADITDVRSDGAPDASLLTLDDHILIVLEAVKTLGKRFTDVAQIRAEKGRTLSTQRLSQVAHLRTDIESIFASTVLSPAPSEQTEIRSEEDKPDLEASAAALALFQSL